MLYGLFILAQSLAFTPAFNAALLSANRMYEIIDRKPQIQSPESFEIQQNGNGTAYKTNVVQQGVSYRGLNFSYPSRPHIKVLQNLIWILIRVRRLHWWVRRDRENPHAFSY